MIKGVGDWEERRRAVMAGVEEVMGKVPEGVAKVAAELRVEGEERVGKVIRKKVSYAVEEGVRVKAYLMMPAELSGNAPGMLCLHQTVSIGKGEPAGLGGKPNLRYGLELAERGYVTLCPDYPTFGEYVYDFAAKGWASGSRKAVWDNQRAVDVLESLPEVERNRVGVIGHSLGGHNAIFTAVFDERLKVVVSSCGFTRFHKYYGGKLKGWTSARYMPLIATKYNNDPDRVPFDFPELIAAIAPRAVFASAPVGDENFEISGVKDCLTAARPIYRLYGNEEGLVGHYPEAGHDFPKESRELAYEFIDRHLKK